MAPRLAVEPAGCPAQFEPRALAVGAPGTLEIMGEWGNDRIRMHYDGVALASEVLGSDQVSHWDQLVADAAGYLWACSSHGQYAEGDGPQTWTVQTIDDPGSNQQASRCDVDVTADGSEAWVSYAAQENGEDDNYVARVVDGVIGFELMGSGAQEDNGTALVVDGSGEPHVVMRVGAALRLYSRDAGVWTSEEFPP